MISLLTSVGFVALLRLSELRKVTKIDLRLALRTSVECSPCVQEGSRVFVSDSSPHPSDVPVRAMRLCLVRKTSQSWATVSDPYVDGCASALLARSRLCQGMFIYLTHAKTLSLGPPHPCNAILAASYVSMIRIALPQVCKIPLHW